MPTIVDCICRKNCKKSTFHQIFPIFHRNPSTANDFHNYVIFLIIPDMETPLYTKIEFLSVNQRKQFTFHIREMKLRFFSFNNPNSSFEASDMRSKHVLSLTPYVLEY